MPVYAIRNDLVLSYGIEEVDVSSEADNPGGDGLTLVDRHLRGVSREIEDFAGPYGLVPAGGLNDIAVEGTYPAWWHSAAMEMALYRMSLQDGQNTKEKRTRYEDWIKRLAKTYPKLLEDGVTPAAAGQGVTIVSGTAAGEREFSASKVVGL